MTQQFILSEGTAQPVIKQGCYVSHGGSLYVADADTSIAGSPSDGSVYIRVSGTTSLTVEFVTDISGYAWNPVYTALTSGSYTLLPYLIVKVKKLFAPAVWTRYNFNPQNHSFGAIKATSVDTGSGAMTFDQGVKTTDSPTFAAITAGTVNTGHGANELYPMNQAVRTTDNVSFNNINPPVNNNDSSLPTIGVGGFTYGVRPARTGNADESFTLPAGGTHMYILNVPSRRESIVGRGSGGSSTETIFGGDGDITRIMVWRIA